MASKGDPVEFAKKTWSVTDFADRYKIKDDTWSFSGIAMTAFMKDSRKFGEKGEKEKTIGKFLKQFANPADELITLYKKAKNANVYNPYDIIFGIDEMRRIIENQS